MPDIALQFNKNMIPSGDMSANITGSWIDISNTLGYCIQASWSGSPVGNIIIQGSLDQSVTKDISTTAAGGGAGQVFSNNDGIHYPWVRVIYTFTSGSGTLVANISGKKYV